MISPHRRAVEKGAMFVILFVFWLLLSGIGSLTYFVAGLLSAAVVTHISFDLFFSVLNPGCGVRALKFTAFLPWLFYKILMANLELAYRILHPSLPIDPSFIRFRTTMPSDMSQTILANAITLTPGTVTVSLDQNSREVTVHAVVRRSSEEELLRNRTMERKLEKIFGVSA